jgi:phage regulator Rha-like protein
LKNEKDSKKFVLQNTTVGFEIPDGFYINNLIQDIRGKKVIVDADLARLYSVKTKRLNEQIKRNATRFPKDFMFQLTKTEKGELVANCDQLNNLKYSSSLPNVFTEHGVVMTASVLNTKRAIEVSIYVVRAFIQLRKAIARKELLTEDMLEIQEQINIHDQAIHSIIKIVRDLMSCEKQQEARIGFTAKNA